MKFAKNNASERMSEQDEKGLFVLKSIMKDHVDNDFALEEMRSELYTLSKLNHPNIVKLYEAYERRRHIYLVMDYCSGGDLTDRHFNEAECALVLSKILSAVAYMHEKGVVHRDLKLENVVLDKASTIKIIDFGLATKYLSDEHKVMTDRVGTIYTMAPQVLQGVYDSKCDLWAIGVIAFMLLSDGINPFWGPPRPMPWSQRRKIMIDRIMRCQYQRMTGPAWDKISPAAKKFVESLLQMDPNDRPTAREALDSEWIRTVVSSPELQEKMTLKEQQQSRKAVSQLKQMAIQLLAQDLLVDDDAMELRSEFEKYDKHCDGHVRLEDFRKVLEEHTSISSSSIECMFADSSLDMTSAISYSDFIIKVLADRDRTITEKTAETLDGLDVDGIRKVHKEKLHEALEGILSVELLEEMLKGTTADDEGMVSTIELLEMLDKSLTSHTRHSLRTIGSEYEEEAENDLIDESNAVIPGGRSGSPQKPKFIYEPKSKSMRQVELEA
jgi:serine/threonine protein kinase